MKKLPLAGVTALLALATAYPATAQNTTVFRQQPAQGSGHRATSAQPQTQPAPAYPVNPGYPIAPMYPRYPVAYTVLPAVIMSDGSIYANLGYGYVPVHQACASQYVEPRVIDASGMLWSGGSPLTTTQPAPAQRTASQLALPSVQAAQRAAATTTQQRVVSACYRVDPYGPVVIVR